MRALLIRFVALGGLAFAAGPGCSPARAATYGGNPLLGGSSNAESAWFTAQKSALMSAVPTLTHCQSIQPSLSHDAAVLGTSVQDAGKEGGALRGTGSAWALLAKATVWQNMKTSSFGVAFQASLGAVASGSATYIGLTDTSGAHQIVVATAFAQDSTHFFGISATAAQVTLGIADTAIHTWEIYSNGTTTTWTEDGTVVGTQANSVSGFATQAAVPGFFGSTAATAMAVYKVVYCDAGPA